MNTFIKKISKLLIPPLLHSYNINKYFNLIFNKKKTKHYINYEKNFYSRHAFVNKAISKFNKCNYLEIGVASNTLFNSIPLKIKNKFGVDPVKGGNFRMTSDEFFLKHSHLKFDVVFIDGLHEYSQCQKDCLNSIKHLNKNGIIFFHDMLPRCDLEQIYPQKYYKWSGDVWKVGAELSNSINVDFRICKIDHGVGILKLKEGFEYKKIPEIKNKTFEDYLNYYKNFKIIDSEEALDFISQD